MHPRFAKPFETLSAPLQAALRPMLGDDFQARFTPSQVATLKAATGLDDRALRLALLPGVEVMLEPAEQPQLPHGIDGAPL